MSKIYDRQSIIDGSNKQTFTPNLSMTAKSTKKGKSKAPRSVARSRKTPTSATRPNMIIKPKDAQILRCAQEQIGAVFNPFAVTGKPCNFGVGADPNFPVKQTLKGTISFTAGSGGNLLVNPCCSNDGIGMYWVSGGPSTTVTTIKAGTTATFTGSPFTSASFGAGLLSQRCIGGAVRVTDISANLYKQGMISSYMHYDEGYFSTTDSFLTFDTNSRRLFGQGKLMQPWVKFDSADSDNFNASPFYHGNTNGDLLFHLPSAASGSAQFFVEAIFFFEVRGPAVQGLVRPVPSDPGVYSVVKTTMEDILIGLNGKIPSATELVKRAVQKLLPSLAEELVTPALGVADKAAKDVISDMLRTIL